MDRHLEHALLGIAGELQLLAFEGDIRWLYEADLRAATRRALQILLNRRVIVEAPVKLSTWKVGPVDVAVHSQKAPTYGALVELKFWKQPGKVVESLWDAFKLASAYKEGLTWAAYLIAAAPEAVWRCGDPLLSLHGDGKWLTSKLWDAHGSLFRSWMTGKGPAVLPAGVRCRRVGSGRVCQGGVRG